MKCHHCNTETSNPKFCSRKCSAIATNKEHPRRKRTNTCSDCKIPILRERKRCSSCNRKFEKERCEIKTIGDYRNSNSVKGRHRSWLHGQIRNLNRTWNKDLTKLPCFICGYSKHVELAHKNPIHSFADDALVRDVNSPNNVVQLCPNCHWEFDNGFLSLN